MEASPAETTARSLSPNAENPLDFNPLQLPPTADPFPLLAQLRENQPVFFSPSLQTWVATRAEDIQTVLKDPRSFSSKQMFSISGQLTPKAQVILEATLFGSESGGLVTTDPPIHTRLRRLLSTAFSARQIAQLKPSIRDLALDLIRTFPAQGTVDIMAQFAHPLPIFVIGRLLGVPSEDYSQLRQWADDMAGLISGSVTEEEQVSCAWSVVYLHEYMAGLLAKRRRVPQNDLSTALLEIAMQAQDRLSIAELVELLVIVLGAGFETTMHFLGISLFFLLQERNYWDALRQCPESIPVIVEECLRLFSPVMGMFRTTTREIQLGSVTLPANAPVYIVLASAGHDEQVFPDAESFCPHRANSSRHLTFGYGIHFCLGAPLACLETCIALEILSHHLPNLRLAKTQQALSYTPGVVMRGIKHLYVERE